MVKQTSDEAAAEVRSQDGPRGTPWTPGAVRNLPWFALLALLGAVVCMAGAIAVLVSSNGQRTDSWPRESTPVKTSVLLAILAALSNACLRFALSEAGTVAWWVMMLRGGTLNDAHRYWEYQTSTLSAALAGRNTNRVAVACLSALMLLAIAPLLQAASFETVETLTSSVDVLVELSSDAPLPPGWSGVRVSHSVVAAWLTPDFTAVLRDFNNQTAIQLRAFGNQCTGEGTNCRAIVVAPGWDVDCSTSYEPYSLLFNPSTAVVGYAQVDFTTLTPEVISVKTAYRASPDLSGLLVVRNCRLRAALVRYPLELSGGQVKLPGRAPSTRNDTVRLLNILGEFQGAGNSLPSTFGGIALAANALYGSNVTIGVVSGLYTLGSQGIMGYTYIDEAKSAMSGYSGTVWRDPGPDIINAIREMTFRSAVVTSAANQTRPRQLASEGSQTVVTGVYRSRYGYLAAVLVLDCLFAVAMAPLFSGWWTLGRSGTGSNRGYTLSPVETARAFAAPLLADSPEVADSNAPMARVLDRVGSREVRYGVSGGKLGISEADSVHPPLAGERY